MSHTCLNSGCNACFSDGKNDGAAAMKAQIVEWLRFTLCDVTNYQLYHVAIEAAARSIESGIVEKWIESRKVGG